MDTQNIILAIPKDVLHKACQIAVVRQTSLAALVTQVILDLVEHEDAHQTTCDRQLAYLGLGMNLGTQGAVTWTREALHER